MHLRSKVVLTSAAMIAASTVGLGAITLAITYQQGVANLQSNLVKMLSTIASQEDPLSAAFYEFTYAEVNVSYQQEDGSITVLQQSFEPGSTGSEVSESLDLGFGEKLIVASSTLELQTLVSNLIPLVFLSAFIFSAASSAVLYWVLRSDVVAIRSLAKFTQNPTSSFDYEKMPKQLSGEIGQLAKSLVDMVNQLEANEENLRNFLSDSSHELKTPLTVIRGHIEILQRDLKDEQSQIRLNTMRSEALKMQNLISDLLLLAEIESQAPLALAEFNLFDTVNEEIASQQILLGERNFEIDVPSGATIVADQRLMRRYLANAISNIRLHTPSQTSAQISLETSPENFLIIVEDSGPGISEQISKTTGARFNANRSESGSGLGLSIMQGIITKHGGVLRLDRSNLGGLKIVAQIPLNA